MLRPPLLALATLLLTACAPTTPGSFRFDATTSHVINYTPRDDARLARRYPDWIRFEYTGPQDAPVSSLWLSPAALSQGAPFNDMLVLTPAAWSRASLRIATTACPPALPPEYPAVRLTIAMAGRVTQHCLAGRSTVCAYDAILQSLTAGDLLSGRVEDRQPFLDICATGFALIAP